MSYTRELVERLMPAVFDAEMLRGAASERSLLRKKRCQHCDKAGDGRDHCSHRCDLDQWGEGCVSGFEGDEFGICRHVHNGRRDGKCGVCWCFSPHDRRASVNVKHGNTPLAMLADVREAWERAPLLQLHRRRLFLRYALDWSLDEIGEEEGGVHKSNIARAVKAGLDAMAEYLEGER